MASSPLKMRGCSALACATASTRNRTFPGQICLFLVSLSLTGLCCGDCFLFSDGLSILAMPGHLGRCLPRRPVALTIFYDRYACHGKFIDAGWANTCYTKAELAQVLIHRHL